VLGLDPGSRFLGYAVLEQDQTGWILIESGVLRLPTEQSIPQRLALAFSTVEGLIDRHQPGHVAVEDCFVAERARAALVLGQVRGVLLLAAVRAHAEVHEFAPRTVKLAAVGNGNASKQQVQAMIPRLVQGCVASLSVDEADAIAIAWCCANQVRLTPQGARKRVTWKQLAAERGIDPQSTSGRPRKNAEREAHTRGVQS
jgi:crossover junction endodeoxyribonuclease RuvC